MKPSEKSPQITQLLEDMGKRSSSLKQNRCVPEPIGCGKLIGEFKDELSEREYSISGLCQKCQDKFFGE